MLHKRTLHLGSYDTAAHGWTLAALELTEPDPVTNIVDVPGRIRGSLDLSRVNTGEPEYTTRTLNATLEISTGDRLEREVKIADLTNQIHGRQLEVIHPDRPNHYAVGLLTVTRLYNDHAHGAVEIFGTCEPWLYSATETVVPLQATTTERTVNLLNMGAMPVVPVLLVEGGSVRLTYNGATREMAAGTYKWPHLFLTPGEHPVRYTGTGKITITYQEAVIR